MWEVIPGLVGSRFQAEAFRAMVEQTEVEFEGFFAPLKRWFSVRVTPTTDGIIASARDVTGWRQTRRVLTREAERLAAVIETQQAVATAGPDLGAVMRVVAERLQALTWAGAAGVFVPEDGALVLCEASGSGREQIGLRLEAASSLVGRAYTSGEPIRSEDLTLEPGVDRAAIDALGARSAIVVPLWTEQHGVQAVVAVWSDRPRAFHELHAHTIRLVAGLLSAALERASAFAVEPDAARGAHRVARGHPGGRGAVPDAGRVDRRRRLPAGSRPALRRHLRPVAPARRLPAGRLPGPEHQPRSWAGRPAPCTSAPTSARSRARR